MAKLCPRGKAAAKAKFDVYPSAYANMYASAVCSGKIVPGGRKRKWVEEAFHNKKKWYLIINKAALQKVVAVF